MIDHFINAYYINSKISIISLLLDYNKEYFIQFA